MHAGFAVMQPRNAKLQVGCAKLHEVGFNMHIIL